MLLLPARLRVAGELQLHEGRVARVTLAGVRSPALHVSQFGGKPAAQHAFVSPMAQP